MSDDDLEEQLDVIGQRVTETWLMVSQIRGFLVGVAVGMIGFELVVGLLGCAGEARAYDIQTTFDTVPGAEAYAVTVGGRVTAIVPGGDPTSTTSVSVQAIGQGTVSAPSNTITIPPPCDRYDLDGDGLVTSSDVLELMLTVQGGTCE